MAKVVTFPKSKPCPICGKPSDPKQYPFCSGRCREVDLNRWLGGHYSISVVEEDEAESTPGSSPEKDA